MDTNFLAAFVIIIAMLYIAWDHLEKAKERKEMMKEIRALEITVMQQEMAMNDKQRKINELTSHVRTKRPAPSRIAKIKSSFHAGFGGKRSSQEAILRIKKKKVQKKSTTGQREICLFFMAETDRVKVPPAQWKNVRKTLPAGFRPQAFTLEPSSMLPTVEHVDLDESRFTLKAIAIDIGHLSFLNNKDQVPWTSEHVLEWMRQWRSAYPSLENIVVLVASSWPQSTQEVLIAAAIDSELGAKLVMVNEHVNSDATRFVSVKLDRLAAAVNSTGNALNQGTFVKTADKPKSILGTAMRETLAAIGERFHVFSDEESACGHALPESVYAATEYDSDLASDILLPESTIAPSCKSGHFTNLDSE